MCVCFVSVVHLSFIPGFKVGVHLFVAFHIRQLGTCHGSKAVRIAIEIYCPDNSLIKRPAREVGERRLFATELYGIEKKYRQNLLDTESLV